MSKSINILIVVIISGFLGISCDSGPDFLKSNGKVIEVEVDLDAFHIINAIDEVDIYLSQGPDQKVSLRAQKNMIPKIELSVEEDILTITDKNLFNWLRTPGNPELHITMSDLKRIEMYDYVNIYAVDTLQVSYLRVYTYATGEVNLLLNANKVSLQSDFISVIDVKGKANSLSVKSINDGKILASELIANDINVNHSGSNIIEVFPLSSLTGTLNGTGDLVYFHEPQELDVKVESTGKVYSDF
ncbi:GIN domain-containing protein [Bacteroidota bacterium]